MMALVFIIFMVVLLLAGLTLVWEVRTGRLVPGSAWSATLRTTVFFAAMVIGTALFVRSAPSSLLLAIALVPVTGLSLYRFSRLIKPLLGRSMRQAIGSLCVLAVVLVLGLSASLSLLPRDLDQRVIIEHIFYGEPQEPNRSIDPDARRRARV